MPDHWVGRAVEAMNKSGPGQVIQRGSGLAAKWSAFKKVGVGGAAWLWTKFILGRGAREQAAYAQAFRDELIRRGQPAP